MHIGFICHEYPPCNHGGIGSFTKDLAEALQKRGCEVTVIGYYIDPVLKVDETVDEVINSVRVLRYPHAKKFSSIPLNTLYLRYRLYAEIKSLHMEKKFDIIESPGGSGWLPFGLPSNISLLTRLHGGEVYTAFQLGRKRPRLISLLEKRQLLNSAQIISVSRYTVETIFNLLNIQKKYEVIYNSVDSELFQVQEVDSKTEKGLVVFVGTIKKAKGVEELVQAMNIVCQANPSAHLILAGKMTALSDKKPYETYLRTLIDDAYQDKIVFAGALDRKKQLIPLLRQAEVCCLPSYVESFSLAPLEAMSLAKAVIFTKLTSGAEAIVDGESGLLCDPKDLKDIADKILLLLDDDILRIKLAKNGQKRVFEKFTFKTWIEQNIAMYNKVIGLNR